MNRIYRPSIHGHGGACTSCPALQCATTAAPPKQPLFRSLSPAVPIGMDGRIIYTCIRSYYEATMHRAHNAIQPPLRHHQPAGPAGSRCPSEIERDRIGYTHHARTIDFLSSCRATLLACRSMQSIRRRGTR
jgi:hypothetical protein